MLRGAPQLSEEPLHPLPRSVRVICARQLVELELGQQLQLFPGKDSAPPAAVEKMAEYSGALDRLRAVLMRRAFEIENIGAVSSAAIFPFGPCKGVAAHEPRDGESQVRIASGELG